MSNIKIKWPVFDPLLKSNTLLNIYDISVSKKKKKTQFRDLVVTNDEKIPDLSLPPGKYLVEAVFPTGQVADAEVSITSRTKSKTVDFKDWFPSEMGEPMAESSLDILDVGVQGYFKSPFSSIRRRNFFSGILSAKSDGLSPSPLAGAGLIQSGYFTEIERMAKGFNKEGLKEAFSTRGLDVDQFAFTEKIDQVGDFFTDLRSWQFVFNGQKITDAGWLAKAKRSFYFIWGEGYAPQFCVIPIPWKMHDAQAEGVRVVIQPGISGQKSGEDFRLGVEVADKDFGAIIGYLGTGQLPAASKVVERGKSMLFEKMEKPLAAAAGAYVLLLAGPSGQDEAWHQWIVNLKNWFAWIPDGAIVLAWLYLLYKKGPDHLREFRKYILEGFRRGLPFYAKGVKLLHDGLMLLANDDRENGVADKEVESALGVVRRLAMQVNMRQPFTAAILR